jgi:hypothetical protein
MSGLTISELNRWGRAKDEVREGKVSRRFE